MGISRSATVNSLRAFSRVTFARHGEGAWAYKFITSIIEQAERGRPLSDRQRSTLSEMQEDYTDTWIQEYRDTYREGAKVLAAYYRRSKMPYWKEMMKGIVSDDDFVPRKNSFMKLWNNRYAKRVIEQTSTAPAFEIRSGVQLRKNQTTRSKYWKYIGKKAFILSDEGIIEAVKGGRGYTSRTCWRWSMKVGDLVKINYKGWFQYNGKVAVVTKVDTRPSRVGPDCIVTWAYVFGVPYRIKREHLEVINERR